MKARFPLYAQIGVVLAANIFLILILRVLLTTNALNVGLESYIYSSAGDRLQAVAHGMFRQFDLVRKDKWNSILSDLGQIYSVKLYLFDLDGKQLAGDSIYLPPKIEQAIKNPPFPLPPFLKRGRPFPLMFHQEGMQRPTLIPREGPDAHVVIHGAGDASFGVGLPPEDGALGRRLPVLESELQEPPRTPLHLSDHLPPSHADHLHVFGPQSSHRVLRNPLEPATGFKSLPPPPPPPHGAMKENFVIRTDNPRQFWLGALTPVAGRPAILLAQTPNIWLSGLSSDLHQIFVAGIILVGLSLLIWWPFVHFMTSAMRKLTTATVRISEGKFDTVLEVERWDEVGVLAKAIQNMSDRLSAFVSGQKRFLGDIAHELASPVARLNVSIELLERDADKSQSAVIKDIREEVEQMASLVNELLAFSKAGLQGRETELVEVELNPLIESTVERLSADGKVEVSLEPNLRCKGDPVLIARAISNVLRNALKYAGESGPITIGGARSGGATTIVIRDRGPGVSDEEIQQLGQPFYRPESSRSRETGGVGLGLAIVRSCIEACGGTCNISNGSPSGLVVELQLESS